MIRILSVLAFVLVSGSAVAQQSTLAGVPTGYQVPGPRHYVINPDGTTRTVDVANRPAAEQIRGMLTPGDPQYIGTTSGENSVVSDK